MAVRKLQLIDEKLRDLTTMRDTLGKLTRECEAGEMQARCPIIETLAGG
jgi:MerR family mercuric resistance operon transcriptional regulator